MKFAAIIWISYNLEMVKRILYAETILGSTVFEKKSNQFAVLCNIYKYFNGIGPH